MDTITELEITTPDEGFTLVELLVVIVILAVLATITMFAVRGMTDKGRTNACASDRATSDVAVESYAPIDNAGMPTSERCSSLRSS